MKKFTILTLSLFILTACGQATAPTTETTPTTTPTTEETISTEEPTSEESTPTEDSTPTAYTMEEVATHNNQDSCWSVVDGKVYDLTDWISNHPGGAGNILKICGIDGSEEFSEQHDGNAQAEGRLDSFYLGDLEQ